LLGNIEKIPTAPRHLLPYPSWTLETTLIEYLLYIVLISESRDIKSYLATAGTLFAGVLGVMLTKISLLIVLSVLSTVIGKMLLLYALFKTAPHHDHHSYKSAHHNAQPFVKYTKDKYYIKHSPTLHSHDVVVDSPSEQESPYHSPYSLESTVHDHKLKGVSYYKR